LAKKIVYKVIINDWHEKNFNVYMRNMHLYICKEEHTYVCSSCSAFSWNPRAIRMQKAFVKPMMHCRPIDVTPECRRRKRLYDSSQGNKPHRYPSFWDTRIDLCACTCGLCRIHAARWDELLVKSHFSKIMVTEHLPNDPVCPVQDHRNSQRWIVLARLRRYPLVVFLLTLLLRSEGIKTDKKKFM